MDDSRQKHPCPDCRQCQWCSDDRCRLCLRSTAGCRRKLTISEQIALYEALNAPCRAATAADPDTASPFCLENRHNPLK